MTDFWGLYQLRPGLGKFRVDFGKQANVLKYGRASSDISVSFYADVQAFRAKKSCCSEIGFVQMVKTTQAKIGNLADWWYNGVWIVDADEDPWYPHQNIKADPSKFMVAATMTDAPGAEADYDIQQEFETCAVCRTGISDGDVYGCFTWGHKFTWGTVSTNTVDIPYLVGWERWLNDARWGTKSVSPVMTYKVSTKVYDKVLYQEMQEVGGVANPHCPAATYNDAWFAGKRPSSRMSATLQKFWPSSFSFPWI